MTKHLVEENLYDLLMPHGMVVIDARE